MFLKHAFAFLAGRCSVAVAGMALAALAGCGGGTGPIINEIIDAQLRNQLGLLPTETARVLLVNQTEATIELDLLVDGSRVTVACTPIEERCEYLPPTCPSTIEVTQERRLDEQGAFLGGRNYDTNPAYTFVRGEFGCQSTIMFTFTPEDTIAEAL